MCRKTGKVGVLSRHLGAYPNGQDAMDEAQKLLGLGMLGLAPFVAVSIWRDLLHKIWVTWLLRVTTLASGLVIITDTAFLLALNVEPEWLLVGREPLSAQSTTILKRALTIPALVSLATASAIGVSALCALAMRNIQPADTRAYRSKAGLHASLTSASIVGV